MKPCKGNSNEGCVLEAICLWQGHIFFLFVKVTKTIKTITIKLFFFQYTLVSDFSEGCIHLLTEKFI